MREMWIIFQREFVARVANKSFILGTLLFPIVMIAIFTIPTLMSGGGSQRTLVLLDAGPPGVANRFAEVLGRQGTDSNDNRYRIERLNGTLAEHQEELNRRVVSKSIDGYVAVPADVMTSNEIVYRARNISSLAVNKDLQLAANRAIQAQRLKESGIEAAKLLAIIKPAQVNSGQVTKNHAGRGSAVSSFLLAYGLAFLIYFTIITQGIGLLRSVLEEKTNRISEVMVSSVKPGYLMAGKIFGAGSAAILQVSAWLAIIAAGVLTLRARNIVPPEVIGALAVDPWTLTIYILFFLLGFFLYAAMYAAMGAMVGSEQEAQSTQSLVLLPLIVPMLFLRAISDDPLGRLATWLGTIPFTSPIAMPMRMASETIPPMQVLQSLALLALGLIAVTWIAGRIYRVGILSTGKKPTMAELIRWIKTA